MVGLTDEHAKGDGLKPAQEALVPRLALTSAAAAELVLGRNPLLGVKPEALVT